MWTVHTYIKHVESMHCSFLRLDRFAPQKSILTTAVFLPFPATSATYASAGGLNALHKSLASSAVQSVRNPTTSRYY